MTETIHHLLHSIGFPEWIQPALVSFVIVFLAEMGDKTQLLAISLSARFRKPWPILAGILVATLVNHAVSAYLGSWAADNVPPKIMAAILGLGFIGFGIWILIPDRYEEEGKISRWGPFVTTTIAFFLVEIGDKTQIATMALGAQFRAPLAVTMGTTLGMMAANGAGVFLGDRIGRYVPIRWIHIATAVIFFALGAAALVTVLK